MMFGSHNRLAHIKCLSQRLQMLGSQFELHVLTDQLNLFNDSRIKEIYHERIDDELMHHATPHAGRKLLLSGERHLTLNKILLWNMTDFRRIIYMDPDIYLQNLPDRLMRTNFTQRIAAVHGCGGYFNSGFIVLAPDTDIFKEIFTKMRSNYPIACDRSKDRDQSVLNHVFKHDWFRLESFWNVGTHYHKKSNYTGLLNRGSNIHFVAELKPSNICNSSSW